MSEDVKIGVGASKMASTMRNFSYEELARMDCHVPAEWAADLEKEADDLYKALELIHEQLSAYLDTNEKVLDGEEIYDDLEKILDHIGVYV